MRTGRYRSGRNDYIVCSSNSSIGSGLRSSSCSRSGGVPLEVAVVAVNVVVTLPVVAVPVLIVAALIIVAIVVMVAL